MFWLNGPVDKPSSKTDHLGKKVKRNFATLPGGQYCIGFGGSLVDRRVSEEILKAISSLGVEASLKAMENLSAGEVEQRATLASKLEQLEYEAKWAFEQYDVVDVRSRLAAAELERRWNEKLEEIEMVRQQLTSLAEKRNSLSKSDLTRIGHLAAISHQG